MSARTELDTLMDQIAEMWGHQDTLLQIITETGQWDHKHGPDWTFADVPYHLAYCNRDLVSRPIKLGREMPDEERLAFPAVEDVHKWNTQKFAERPTDQTVEQSLAALRISRDEIRDAVAGWSDADLERPIWMPFMGGNWVPARNGLFFTLNHDWSEFMQLRIHMGRSVPVPSPEITTTYLGAALGMIYPGSLNKEAARDRQFSTVMAFSDPKVSDFSVEVSAGEARVRPGQAADPDLVITQSAETFEKTIRGMQLLAEAMQDGSVRVSDMEKLAAFGELFPMN
jgi:hypothetical protein